MDLEERQNKLRRNFTALTLEHGRALAELDKVNNENYLLEQERNYLKAKIGEILRKAGFELDAGAGP